MRSFIARMPRSYHLEKKFCMSCWSFNTRKGHFFFNHGYFMLGQLFVESCQCPGASFFNLMSSSDLSLPALINILICNGRFYNHLKLLWTQWQHYINTLLYMWPAYIVCVCVHIMHIYVYDMYTHTHNICKMNTESFSWVRENCQQFWC